LLFSRKGLQAKWPPPHSAGPSLFGRKRAKDEELPIAGKLLHASSGPAGESMSQEGDLFRRPQLAIFVGVAWNPLRACTYLAALSWRAGIEQRARAISFWN
jgi:hypothetical protein